MTIIFSFAVISSVAPTKLPTPYPRPTPSTLRPFGDKTRLLECSRRTSTSNFSRVLLAAITTKKNHTLLLFSQIEIY